MLGWVERDKGFYHLGSCLGQQQYSFPKIKLIIGHPKTSLKQIIMFLPDLQKKSVYDRRVVGAQKNSLG